MCRCVPLHNHRALALAANIFLACVQTNTRCSSKFTNLPGPVARFMCFPGALSYHSEVYVGSVQTRLPLFWTMITTFLSLPEEASGSPKMPVPIACSSTALKSPCRGCGGAYKSLHAFHASGCWCGSANLPSRVRVAPCAQHPLRSCQERPCIVDVPSKVASPVKHGVRHTVRPIGRRLHALCQCAGGCSARRAMAGHHLCARRLSPSVPAVQAPGNY